MPRVHAHYILARDRDQIWSVGDVDCFGRPHDDGVGGVTLDGRQVVRFLRNRSEPRCPIEHRAVAGLHVRIGPARSLGHNPHQLSPDLLAKNNVDIAGRCESEDSGRRTCMAFGERVGYEDAGINYYDGEHVSSRMCSMMSSISASLNLGPGRGEALNAATRSSVSLDIRRVPAGVR